MHIDVPGVNVITAVFIACALGFMVFTLGAVVSVLGGFLKRFRRQGIPNSVAD